MKITRVSPSSFEALTEEQLSEWLHIEPDTDTFTTAMLLASATEVVEGVTGLTLASGDFRIVFDRRMTCLPLPLDPVQSVNSVEIAGEPVSYSLRGGDIVLDAFPTGDVVVEVTAGFDDPSLIPISLRHAIAVIMAAGFDGRESVDSGTMKTVDWLCAPHRRMVL